MNSNARILIVDDEPDMLENCRRLLEPEGYECDTLQNPMRFRDVLRETRPDLVLLDLRMPNADGMTVLAASLADDPTLPVIMLTAYASIGSAVRAMREGAFDYLPKPFSADQLQLAVARALRYRGLAQENEALRAQVQRDNGAGMVGSSPEFLRVVDQARKVARTDANVLITGESGTGKDVLARFIHAGSSRGARPFIPVDCASLPEGLLESELFGHKRGAFTGAIARKQGLLAEGDGGSVFLDEVAEMSPLLQSKLLRVLEERVVRRVGHAEFIKIDIRVIAATNVDLERAVEAGDFREDLYYRLNVVPFRMPPLRKREGDVALLMQSFLEQLAAESGCAPPRVSPEVWEALDRYAWPGNIRELRNLAHRLMALDEDGRITLSDLPGKIRGSPLPRGEQAAGPEWSRLVDREGRLPDYESARERAMQEFQAGYVHRILADHDGNVTRAAEAARVSRRSFHRWLADLGPQVREGAR
jgi:DNA-binding NtrC family response regulator